MMTLNRFFVSLLFSSVVTAYTPITGADVMRQDYGSPQQQIYRSPQLQSYGGQQSYGSEIGLKALNGFANLTTGFLEMPKNIINTSNQSNIFYGIIGGLFKGMVNTGGRMAVGLTDLITFQLPTKPIAYPLYIWDDFDVDTSYGDIFRLQEEPPVEQPIVQTPPPQAPAPAAAAPQPAVSEYPVQYPQNTSKKLDTIFKQKMMK